MRRCHVVAIVCILSASFVVAPARTDVLAQLGSGGIEPDLRVEDMIDWNVLYVSLASSGVSAAVEDQFESGRKCRSIGQEIVYEDGWEIDYESQLLFQSGSEAYRLDWEYAKDETSGNDPAIPPDAITTPTETSVAATSAGVIIPTQIAYDFLLEVLDAAPTMVSEQLDTKTLNALWVEVDGSTYTLYLRFEDGDENRTTKRVWTTYDNGSFGILEND